MNPVASWHCSNSGRVSRTQRKLAGTGSICFTRPKALCSIVTTIGEKEKNSGARKITAITTQPLGLSAFGKGTYLYMWERHLMKEDLGNRRKLKITPEIG